MNDMQFLQRVRTMKLPQDFEEASDKDTVARLHVYGYLVAAPYHRPREGEDRPTMTVLEISEKGLVALVALDSYLK